MMPQKGMKDTLAKMKHNHKIQLLNALLQLWLWTPTVGDNLVETDLGQVFRNFRVKPEFEEVIEAKVYAVSSKQQLITVAFHSKLSFSFKLYRQGTDSAMG